MEVPAKEIEVSRISLSWKPYVSIFQRGWNHQPDSMFSMFLFLFICCPIYVGHKFLETSGLGDSCSENRTQPMEVGMGLATPIAMKIRTAIFTFIRYVWPKTNKRIAVVSSSFPKNDNLNQVERCSQWSFAGTKNLSFKHRTWAPVLVQFAFCSSCMRLGSHPKLKWWAPSICARRPFAGKKRRTADLKLSKLVPSPWLAHWPGERLPGNLHVWRSRNKGLRYVSPQLIFICDVLDVKGESRIQPIYNIYYSKYCKFQSLQVTHLVLKFRMEYEHGWKRGEIAPDSQPPPRPCGSQAWQWTSQYLSKMARFKVREKPIPFATHYLYLVSFLGESGL